MRKLIKYLKLAIFVLIASLLLVLVSEKIKASDDVKLQEQLAVEEGPWDKLRPGDEVNVCVHVGMKKVYDEIGAVSQYFSLSLPVLGKYEVANKGCSSLEYEIILKNSEKLREELGVESYAVLARIINYERNIAFDGDGVKKKGTHSVRKPKGLKLHLALVEAGWDRRLADIKNIKIVRNGSPFRPLSDFSGEITDDQLEERLSRSRYTQTTLLKLLRKNSIIFCLLRYYLL